VKPLTVGSRGLAHEPFERFAERRLGVVPHAASDVVNLGVRVLQKLQRFAQTIALQVALRCCADAHPEARGETGARQIRLIGQRRNRPGMFWTLMKGAEGASDGGIAFNVTERRISVTKSWDAKFVSK